MNRDYILKKLKIVGRISIFLIVIFFIKVNKRKEPTSEKISVSTFVEEEPSFGREMPVALDRRPIQTSFRPPFASVSFFWEDQRRILENVQSVKTALSQKVENSITRPQQARTNVRRSMAELEEDRSRPEAREANRSRSMAELEEDPGRLEAREASRSRSPIRLSGVRPTGLRTSRNRNEENNAPRAQRRASFRTSRNRNQENNIPSERERAGSPVSSETSLNDNRGTDLDFQYLPTLDKASLNLIRGMPPLPEAGYSFEAAGFKLELGTGSLPLYLGVPIRVVDMRLGGEADLYFSPTGLDDIQDRSNINVPDHKLLPEYSSIGEESNSEEYSSIGEESNSEEYSSIGEESNSDENSSIGEESNSDENPCYMLRRCAAKRRPQLIHHWNHSMEWSEDPQTLQSEAVCEASLAQLLKTRDVIYNTIGAGFTRLVDRYSQIENPQVVLSRNDADNFHRQSLAYGKAHIHYKAILETLPSFQEPPIRNPTSLDYQNGIFHAMASQQLLEADEDFSHTIGKHLSLKAPVENLEADEATTSTALRSVV